MKRSIGCLAALCLLLSACLSTAEPAAGDPERLVATGVAVALTQTALIATSAPQLPTLTLSPQSEKTPDAPPATLAAGLKPADSDTPAAGICAQAAGELQRIELGAGPDGLPLAGRCWVLPQAVRLQLVNGTDAPLVFNFARYHVDLSPRAEMLLDSPVGEYLAPGVHFLPHGPEIWVK